MDDIQFCTYGKYSRPCWNQKPFSWAPTPRNPPSDRYTAIHCTQNEALLWKIAVFGNEKYISSMEECKIPAWDKMFCHLQGAFGLPEQQFSIFLCFVLSCKVTMHGLGVWDRISTPKDVSLIPPCSHSFFSKGKSQENSEMFFCMKEY